MAESEVDRIMELADTDGSGSIEFSEWLVVSINLNKLLTEEKFKAAFTERARQLKVGDPLAEDSKQGAIVSKMHFEKILRCIDTAKQEGGKILCGGHSVASSYGLAATIWTQDISRATRVAAQLESGIIWINCWLLRDLRTPFGGMKNSGVGREGGWEALRFFTEAKNVCVEL